MKIAVIAHAYFAVKQPYAGGLEAHTDQLVRQLLNDGHDVTLYAKTGTVADCPVVPMFRGNARRGKSKLYDLGYKFACRRIQLQNYELIINNSLHHYPIAWHSPAMPPMVTILHTPPLPNVITVLSNQLPQANRSYIAVSESTARQWRPYCSDAIAVVPNGIEMNNWRQFSAAPPTPMAVWTGRITPEKGTHVAVQAALKAGLPLTICGSIYDKKYFKTRIAPYIDNVRIKYVGHLDQKAINELYARSSVALVTPLWEEPFGLVAVEALACGVPVAALPNGALPTIINSKVGAIATSNTPEDLQTAIRKALRADRQACITYARTNYSISMMVDGYMNHLPMQQSAGEQLQWQTYQ